MAKKYHDAYSFLNPYNPESILYESGLPPVLQDITKSFISPYDWYLSFSDEKELADAVVDLDEDTLIGYLDVFVADGKYDILEDIFQHSSYSYGDLLIGATTRGYAPLAEYLSYEMPESSLSNRTLALKEAAEMGRMDLIEPILKPVRKYNVYFEAILRGAMEGNHEGIAIYVLENVTKSTLLDFALLGTVKRGQSKLANYLLSKFSFDIPTLMRAYRDSSSDLSQDMRSLLKLRMAELGVVPRE